MRLRDEQGMMAIGVALMLIVVLALFGGVLWQYSMAEMKRVERTEHDLQALFLARAGAEAVMAAWLEESISNKPAGAMARIYYNSSLGVFQTTEPANSLGYVDVVVTKIDDPGGERDQLTEIVATAKVQNVSKIVKMTTFPHALGHELAVTSGGQPVGWYEYDTGIIRDVDLQADELVILRTKNNVPIRAARSIKPLNTGFSAPILLFISPLNLGEGQTYDGRVLAELGSNILYNLPVQGDVIFFTDVILATLPSKYDAYTFDYGVILQLPPGSAGISGSTIAGADSDAKYGKVYFDGTKVAMQKFVWSRSWFIIYFYSIKKDGNLVALSTKNTSNNKTLAGNAFYFRDGTDLSNIKNQDLIYIPPDGTRANEMKDIKPFVWE